MPDGSAVPFTEFLTTVEDGVFQHDATDRLRDLVLEMNRLGERGLDKVKGKLTLTFDLQVEAGVFAVRASIETRKPKMPRIRSLMYPSRAGDLTLHNPRQLDAFRDVEPAAKPRDVLPITTARAAEAS